MATERVVFYVLRYAADVPLTRRKHGPTVGRWPTWDDAEGARQRLPRVVADLLGVHPREEPEP